PTPSSRRSPAAFPSSTAEAAGIPSSSAKAGSASTTTPRSPLRSTGSWTTTRDGRPRSPFRRWPPSPPHTSTCSASMRRALAALYAARWAPRSRLMLAADRSDWVIAYEMDHVASVARSLGIKLASPRFVNLTSNQSVFFGSQFDLLHAGSVAPPHAIATAYFHGRPGTDGSPEFDACYEALQRLHDRIDRVQVTHVEMRDLAL